MPISGASRCAPKPSPSAAPITETGDHGIETIVAVRHPKPDEPGEIAVVSPCGICRELIHDYDAKARVIVPERQDGRRSRPSANCCRTNTGGAASERRHRA